MKPIIGLEIHVQLKTKRKMFCDCKNDPEEKLPNVNVCPICLGYPGTLPSPNKKAIEMVLKVGKALNCQFPEISKFDRKNYFYPDLPKGYQISQYDQPLCFNGFLEIEGRKIRIRRIHLEEDTGRSMHFKDKSLIDFNRAGVPLMELVTEPDIRSAKEAKKFCQELQLILRYLGVSDADMEKGEMRCEVNISLEASKEDYKVEIKNLNSFKAVEEAIEYEIKRQLKLLEEGKKLESETRGWDPEKKETFPQRRKEKEADYRYFPEPDLPPIELKDFDLEKIFSEIGELPSEKRKRLKEEYPELKKEEIEVLVEEKEATDFFEETFSEAKALLKGKDTSSLLRTIINLMLTDLRGLMLETKNSFKELALKPKEFAKLCVAFYEKKITSPVAKKILKELYGGRTKFEELLRKEEFEIIGDEASLKKLAKEVIEENPKPVADYLSGKENALNFLVGKLMAKTRGKADPELSQKIFKALLKEISQKE